MTLVAYNSGPAWYITTMRRINASDHLDLKVAQHFAAPAARPQGFAGVRAYLGSERFGRPVAPWGGLIAPVPVGAALILTMRVAAPPQAMWPWLADRLCEAAWLCLAPFVLATIYQAIRMAVSDHLWKETEGDRHLDYSPRMAHYLVGIGVAAAPLVALQLSNRALNAYLLVGALARSWLLPGHSAHVGYDPDLGNLMVLGVLPLVLWQARRLLVRVPAGRLLGFGRDLARLKGAVAWDPQAWGEMVGETFERWMADLHPTSLSREKARQHRLRWMNLHREVVAAYQQSPPDVARANRALATYRQGL